MFKNVLVVCVGNICRSPLGERLLQAKCPHLTVTSAGIGALVGHAADDTASAVAAEHDVSLDGHVARQLDTQILLDNDLILVMEAGHKAAVSQMAPQISGRVMLADHWGNGRDIDDPYRKSKEFHQLVYDMLNDAMSAWAERLKG